MVEKMKITRRHLRKLIKEEMKNIAKTQLSSENPITNQAFDPPSKTSRPYITGRIDSSDGPQTIQSMTHRHLDALKAEKMFASQKGISTDDYDITCQPQSGGSWSCMARKSTLGAESVYSAESEFAPAGSESMEESKNMIREMIWEAMGDMQKAKIFLLIGPPSVGKSEWIRREGPKHGIVNPYTISMDDVTDQVGDKYGLDYDEMFEKPIQPGQPGYTEDQYSEEYGEMIDQPLAWKTWEPKVWSKVAEAQASAMSEHERIVDAAAISGRPVVVDMTNMNKGGRERMIKQIDAPNHELIAVVFDWNEDVEFLKTSSAERARERFEKTGRRKTIPPEAFDRMVGGYQPPTDDEGWDNIIHVPAWWVENK